MDLSLIKAKLIQFGKDVWSASKELGRLSVVGYHKAKPHVLRSCRKIGPACRKAYHHTKPHVKKAYGNVKSRMHKAKTEPKRSRQGSGFPMRRLIKPALIVIGISLVLWLLMSLLSGSGTPENAVEYKFPDEREFSYPEPTAVECPEGMSEECSSGFYDPASDGCPISCDDDDPCTSDECSEETGFECVNTEIAECSY